MASIEKFVSNRGNPAIVMLTTKSNLPFLCQNGDTETFQYNILCFCLEGKKTHMVHTVRFRRHEVYITDKKKLHSIGMFHHQKSEHHFDTKTAD
jgi:hypothetical protein